MTRRSNHAKRSAALLLAGILLAAALLPTAYASKAQDLQNNVEQARSEYNAASSALETAREHTSEAENRVSTLNAQVKAIMESITTINNQIDDLNQRIAELQQQIAEKETEIAERQADIDSRWQGFKDRMAAMQELNDSGAMAMLGTISNLYQFLTFSEVLQDISAKDTEVIDDMQQRKAELEAAKQELETARQELEDAAAQLDEQKAQLEARQNELAASLRQANAALSEAEAAEEAQQILTEETRRKWEQARAEQEAYVKSQLQNNQMPSLSCGLNFRAPLPYYTRISTYFGVVDAWHSRAHGGTDFAAPAGTTIYAVEDGVVVIARYSSSYGNYVVINHGTASDGNTYATLYAHMTSYAVSSGQWVARGDVIGYVGTTGNSTGNHLHLELWRNNIKIDPLSYIPTK